MTTRVSRVLGVVALFIFGIVVVPSQVNAAGIPPKFTKMVTSDHQVMVGEKFSAKIYLKSYKTIKSVQILLDGKAIKTCGSVSICGAVIGPFSDVSVGEHVYTFVVKGKNGDVLEPWGKFWVNSSDEDSEVVEDVTSVAVPVGETLGTSFSDSPELVEIITNNHQLKVGEKFSMQVYAKSKTPIDGVWAYLDGKLVATCKKSPCSAVVGPFGEGDVGEHKYVFVVSNKNGKFIQPWGKFWVNSVSQPQVQPVPVAVSNGPEFINILTQSNNGHYPYVGDTFALKINAKDAKGIATIAVKLDGKVIYTCSGVTTCGTTVGPFITSDLGEHKYEFVVTNLDGKFIEPWGKFTVKEKAVTPTPIQETSGPEWLQIITNSNKLTVGDNFTLKVYTKDAVGISKIVVRVNGNTVATCYDTTICGTTVGPQNVIGKHHYSFYVENKAGKSIAPDGYFTVEAKAEVQPTPVPVIVPVPAVMTPELIAIYSDGYSINKGSQFVAKIEAKDAAGIAKITFYVDGKLTWTCLGLTFCSVKSDPMMTAGVHTYRFVVENVNGKTIAPEGKFTVVEKAETAVPVPAGFESKTGYEITQGGEFTVTVLSKDDVAVREIRGYINGVLHTTCTDLSLCFMRAQQDIVNTVGTHTFKFILDNKEGKTADIEGKLRVIAKQ